jgi:hypothetical protein
VGEVNGTVTWGILLPVLATLLGVLIAQAVTVYNTRAVHKAQLRDAALRRDADLARDLRGERVAQYAKLLTAARGLYTYLESLPPAAGSGPNAANTAQLAAVLGPDFLKRLDAFNESANAVRLLSGPDVRACLRQLEELVRLSAATRAFRAGVSSLPSFTEPESRLIAAMTEEVQPAPA